MLTLEAQLNSYGGKYFLYIQIMVYFKYIFLYLIQQTYGSPYLERLMGCPLQMISRFIGTLIQELILS